MTGNSLDRRQLLAGGIVILVVGAVAAVGVLGVGDGGNGSDVDDGSAVETDVGPSPVLSVEDVEVAAGETTTTAVTVETLPRASSGFSLTVAVGDPGVATITNAAYNDELNLLTEQAEIAGDGSSASLVAADVRQNLQTDSGTITVGTITLEGQTDATTDLTFENASIDDTDGDDMGVQVESGTVTVGSG